MINYSLDPARKIATTRVEGPFSFAELANHLHCLLRDREFHADFDAIIIATNVAAIPPPAAIGTLAPLVRAWSSRRRGVRWAFVLPTRESLAFIERALGEVRLPDVSVQCFISEPEARRWLSREKSAVAVPSAVTPAR
jgi:hypothetical protein